MTVFEQLQRQPEYVHTLLNPIPIYGLAAGLLGLLLALIFRSRTAQIATLAIVFVSAFSAWPVAEFGQRAADRVLSMADEEGQAWLKEHEHRVDRVVLFYYLLAALAVAALAAPVKWPRSGFFLASAVLLLGCVALGCGGYIAYAGGKIRHREFRNEPAPKTESSD